MVADRWLPNGFRPRDDVAVGHRVAAGEQWQVYEASTGGRALVAMADLASRWLADGLLAEGQLHRFDFGKLALVLLDGGRDHRLEPVDAGAVPRTAADVQALVAAIVASRATGCRAAFDDAVYVERLSRLLPDYSPNAHVDDALVAGLWTSGGVALRLAPSRRMRALVPWLEGETLQALAAQLATGALVPQEHAGAGAGEESAADGGPARERGALPAEPFRLPGRPHLEDFFNEHVVDLVRHEARYNALGIHFPGAVLLHGPPGCGKTFAVEALVDYLDWPSFPIDSGSIGSPYIHETGRKIAEVFAKAAEVAPAVVVIDEIDAFLAARDDAGSGGNQHRVEEVAEFLRGIPKAAEHRVLVIGMTNRLASLDPAVVRRGRFDHILDVGMPSRTEILALLAAKLAQVPCDGVDQDRLATALAGRPLSDLGYIVKDACRRAARAGLDRVRMAEFDAALAAAPARSAEEKKPRRIGFV